LLKYKKVIYLIIYMLLEINVQGTCDMIIFNSSLIKI